MGAYRQAFERARRDPEGFWREQAALLPGFEPGERICAPDEHGVVRWFPDSRTNTCWLALDRHVEAGQGDRTALVHDSPATGTRRRFTYRELRDEVARLAGALRDLGVGPGDRVVIYMPMVPEAAFAMLACARLGAIHSVVFGGFAARELALRIDDARPRVLLTASCGIEFDRVVPYGPLVEAALARSEHPPEHVLMLQRPEGPADPVPGPGGRPGRDWAEAIAGADPAPCVEVAGTHPLYVLYTSGTTGRPKGVLRDTAGHAVALRYSMATVYGVEPGEVFWAASDVGWVVGHSYIVYAPLLTGCTTVLYEGKPVRTPDAGAFWRVIAEHGVGTFFAAPTAFRAIRKEDPDGALLARHDVRSLRRLFVAGERLDPPTYEWLAALLDVPVIDHWWQTELGWPALASPAGLETLPTRAGSASFPVPGFDLRIVSDEGEPVPAGTTGHVVLGLPLPPGCMPTVWGDHARFEQTYLQRFPGSFHTGDAGVVDEDGYVTILGRTDDVINVAGHRLSTGELEEVVGAHGSVAECAVIGVPDAQKGEVPLGLVVLKDGAADDPALEAELVSAVRSDVGPIACYRRTIVVPRLPKTRSGKILRGSLRALARGESVTAPSTIEDPTVLDELAVVLRSDGDGDGSGS